MSDELWAMNSAFIIQRSSLPLIVLGSSEEVKVERNP
jgi:hypothetical protein